MEQLFTEASAYYQGVLADIAQQRIDLEVYIFAEDTLGQRFIDALAQAAQRGVAVRIMLDGVGSGDAAHSILDQLQSAGVEARIYHPLPWRFWQWRYATYSRYGANKWLRLFSFLNRRNHRKLILIDQSIAWLGSFNICQQHLSLSEGGEGWRDTGLRLSTYNADELEMAFDYAWNNPGQPIRIRTLLSGQFRLNYSYALRRSHYRDLLRRIGQAHQRVWITNAYFLPQAKLLRALVHAAQRGLDVRLMLPAYSDVVFMPWATAQFYEHLLVSGVKIFEYQAGVLHAKTMVIDHWACVGSSNLNSRSVLHDLEVDAVLRETATIQSLERQFLHDQLSAQRVTKREIKAMSLPKKWLGRLVLLLRYWL